VLRWRFRFSAPAGASADRLMRKFYVGEGTKLAVTVVLFVVVFVTMKIAFAAFSALHRHAVCVLDCACECPAAVGRDAARNVRK
jgi:F0F1-type ATP synthase assembly protein I